MVPKNIDETLIYKKDGSIQTLDQWLKEEKEKSQATESRLNFKKESGTFVPSIIRSVKKRGGGYTEPKKLNDRVISTKIWTPKEIAKLEKENNMSGTTVGDSKSRKDRLMVLSHIIENKGEWVRPRDVWIEGISLDLSKTGDNASFSSLVSSAGGYLESIDWISKRPAPMGRGYLYLYKGPANVNLIDLEEKVREYRRNQTRRKSQPISKPLLNNQSEEHVTNEEIVQPELERHEETIPTTPDMIQTIIESAKEAAIKAVGSKGLDIRVSIEVKFGLIR